MSNGRLVQSLLDPRPIRHLLGYSTTLRPTLSTQTSRPLILHQWHSTNSPVHRLSSLLGKHMRSATENEEPSSTTSTSLSNVIESVAHGTSIIRTNASRLNGVYTRLAQSAAGRLMRWDKPTGTFLLFYPSAWAIALGSSSLTQGICLTTLFGAGSILLRGAGCTVNDMWDRDVDRQVERTKSRPLASGEVSLRYAGGLLLSQLGGGLYILTQLNEECFPIAALSVIPVLFYPLAKRSFNYPQLVLALTFNAGTLLGYTAASASLASVVPFTLYAAACSWTMTYDTIYAFQDVKDDRKIGVHSTAITFADYPKLYISTFAASKYAILLAAGSLADLSTAYYMCLSVAAAHEARYIANTDLGDASQCKHAFDSNITTGGLTWLGFVLGRLF